MRRRPASLLQCRYRIGYILLTLLLLITPIGSAADAVPEWRSSLYPLDWEPGFTDAEGRFLHDFSYAGYHAGEKPLPTEVPGMRADVTQPPYNADNTGKLSASKAIQQAINDVGLSGGGIVYLPEGTYRLTFEHYGVNNAIFITYSNVVLQGAGVDKTFLFLDEKVTRNKTMISVKSVFENFSWGEASNTVTQALRADMNPQEKVVPLDGTPRFSVGDWVVVQFDLTDEWVAEHNMSDGWDATVRGPSFFRQVVAVDHTQNAITLDAPVRYAVKVRDNGRVYKVGDPLQEIGLADFSIGMRENPNPAGWAWADHSTPGAGAYDVHGSIAVLLHGVVNSWVRNVATYQVEGNRWAHIHSIGFYLDQSRHVTLSRVSVENPQYRGGNGNGYGFVSASQDCLFDNVRAVHGLNNITLTTMKANGNVIFGGYIGHANQTQTRASNFHAHLSMANLIDNLTIDGDRFDAVDRSDSAGVAGFPKHGLSTTASVFWNINGLAYRYDLPAIIHSQQYGWGYVIGSRGPASKVMVSANERTAPVDFLEGEGQGAGLNPQSLYLDQLERRLLREGKLAQWEAVKAGLTLLPVEELSASDAGVETTSAIPMEEQDQSDDQLPLIYSEDFESVAPGELPPGWEWLLTGNSADKPAVIREPHGNQALALTRTDGSNLLSWRAYYEFEPVKERLQISFRMLAANTQRGLRFLLGGTSQSPAAVHGAYTYSATYFITINSKFQALRDGPTNKWTDAGFYTPGKWVKVTLDIDIPSQSFNVYLDDAQTPGNIEPISLLYRYDDLNTFSFAYQTIGSHNNTTPIYIDDIVIRGK
ncbi:MAG TPA: hypothetical protein GXZ82_09140 [Firmicutes bacterium]|nr:hypothetical protein [Bacillota bacterium]